MKQMGTTLAAEHMWWKSPMNAQVYGWRDGQTDGSYDQHTSTTAFVLYLREFPLLVKNNVCSRELLLNVGQSLKQTILLVQICGNTSYDLMKPLVTGLPQESNSVISRCTFQKVFFFFFNGV